MTTFYVGSSIRTRATFRNESNALSPVTNLSLVIRDPDGVETIVQTPAITNPSTGVYEYVFELTKPGVWLRRWKGNIGTFVIVSEKTIKVPHTEFANV